MAGEDISNFSTSSLISRDFNNSAASFTTTITPLSSDEVPSSPSFPSEVLYVSTIVFLSILFILGSFANTILLMAFFRRPALRTTSNRFVVNLLIVNVLSSCLMLPLLCLDLSSTSSFIPSITTSIQCRLTEFVITWISSLSVFSTLAISFDQYLAILYPLRYQNLITKGRSWSLIIGSWIIPILTGCLCTSIQDESALSWETCAKREDPSLQHLPGSASTSVGSVSPPPPSLPPPYCWTCIIFPILNFVFIFLAPALFISYIYIRIYTEAKSNSKRTRRTSINPAEHMFNSKTSPDPKRNQRPSVISNLYTQTPPPVISSRSAQLKRSPSQQFMDNIKHKISNASQFMYREESRTAKISMIVIVLVALCWGPFYIYLLGKGLRLEDERLFPYWSKCIILGLTCLYSVISPMVFAYRSKRLQSEVRKLFHFRSDEHFHNRGGSGYSQRRRLLHQQRQQLLSQHRSRSTPASPVQKKTSMSEDEKSLLPPLMSSIHHPLSHHQPRRKMSTIIAPDLFVGSTRSSISSASGASSNTTAIFHLESSERS
ncbi:adenosine receptor A2b [Lepeophtheirus salmonis]|uniref:adenosine receptor A2b n=1 Tax=Lepeophtheirus salmonis TaxID=72036 RepID=UPI001AE8780E|nr:G-protein coupled receptor 61-like [Lepeophtheirus salmonis]